MYSIFIHQAATPEAASKYQVIDNHMIVKQAPRAVEYPAGVETSRLFRTASGWPL
jgi:hypothetical protein